MIEYPHAPGETFPMKHDGQSPMRYRDFTTCPICHATLHTNGADQHLTWHQTLTNQPTK